MGKLPTKLLCLLQTAPYSEYLMDKSADLIQNMEGYSTREEMYPS